MLAASQATGPMCVAHVPEDRGDSWSIISTLKGAQVSAGQARDKQICFEEAVGLDDLLKSFPIQIILSSP